MYKRQDDIKKNDKTELEGTFTRFLNTEQNQFSSVDDNLQDESIKSLIELGEVLQKIHNRMVYEGYELNNGIIQVNPRKSNE